VESVAQTAAPAGRAHAGTGNTGRARGGQTARPDLWKACEWACAGEGMGLPIWDGVSRFPAQICYFGGERRQRAASRAAWANCMGRGDGPRAVGLSAGKSYGGVWANGGFGRAIVGTLAVCPHVKPSIPCPWSEPPDCSAARAAHGRRAWRDAAVLGGQGMRKAKDRNSRTDPGATSTQPPPSSL
jgi:hypothetical protein